MKKSQVVFKALYWSILCITLLQAGSNRCKIITNQPGSLIIQVSIDSLTAENGHIRTYPSTAQSVRGGFPVLPVISETFVGLPPTASYEIYTDTDQRIDNISPYIGAVESAKGMELQIDLEPWDKTDYPSSQVNIFSVRDIKGHPSSTIEIYPAIIRNNSLLWYKTVSVKFTWADHSGFTARPLATTGFAEIPADSKPGSHKISSIPAYQHSESLARISLSKTGWYVLTYSDLADSGIAVKDVDPQTFRLWNHDQEIMLYISGENDHSFDNNDQIIFFGEKAPPPASADYQNNFYTDENVYWLSWGNSWGVRYISESGYPNLPENQVLQPQSYRHREHIEEDHYFSRLGSMHTHDRWDTFDHFFMEPPVNAGTSEYYTFNLPTPYQTTTSRFSVTIELQGITDGKHILEAYINQNKVASASWSQQNTYRIESTDNPTLTNNILKNGANTLMLTLDGSGNDNEYDQVYLNWLEIEYDRQYRADNNLIIFSRDSELPITTQFEIAGFENDDIFVFKDGISRIQDFIILWDNNTKSNKIIFQDYSESRTDLYHAFTSDRLMTVESIRPVEPISDITSIAGTEYIVIAPDSFSMTLEPLVEHHNGLFFNIDDIYRQYSSGTLSPYAIRDFLTDAYRWWNPKPQAVLIGMQAGIFSWTGGYNPGDEYIPAMKIQTYKWGAGSSDFWYTLVDGDDLIPEFSIGRYPAKDKTELETMVSKTIQILEGTPSNWQNQLLMIAGYEETFKDQSESMLFNIIDKGFMPRRLYINKYSEGGIYFGSTDTLLRHFSDGMTYINFLGHGGGAVWGDRSLLTIDDLDFLSNPGKTPFVTSMTCFTGDVSNPDALGRKLMHHENGGVAAWFGSAGVGWIINDYLLLQPIQNLMFNQPDLSIGEIINQAKINYYSTNSAYPDIAITQLYQFNLSGDPALVLPWPDLSETVANPSDPEPGESIEVTFPASPVDSICWQLFNDDLYPIVKYPQQNHGSNFSLDLSDTLEPGIYNLNLSWQSNTGMNRSNRKISISDGLARIVALDPELPTARDSITVLAEINDRQSLASVELVVNGNTISGMSIFDQNIFISDSALPPQAEGQILDFRCRVTETSGHEYLGPILSYQIPYFPRYTVNGIMLEADDNINLTAMVTNSTLGTGSTEVFFQRYINNAWTTLGIDTLHFSGSGSLKASASVSLPSGSFNYRVFTSSSHGIYNDTSATTIETDAFRVTPELGTSDDQMTHGNCWLDNISITIPPATVNQPLAVKIIPLSVIDNSLQSQLIPLAVDSAKLGFELQATQEIDFSGQWGFNFNPGDSAILFQFFNDRNIWLPIEYTPVTETEIEFTATLPARFCFMTSVDQEPPQIEATVNGQHILDSSYLNKNPSIDLMIQDNNGADHRSAAIKIWLNDLAVITPDLMFNSGTVNSLGIQYSPNLTAHDTTIAIVVTDASGNQSDTLELNFMVSEELQLIDYGNFPNPFTDQTRFAYELTETVDKFSLDIYTVSGRRIRRLKQGATLTDLDPRIGAYHEIVWDGRDKNGEFVANGVYFYQFTVSKGKTKIQKRGKIAKAR